jgi:aminoglycoside/choline kinase family phosphotransferase
VFSGVFIVMQSELVQRVRLSAARVRPEQIGAEIELLPPHASSRRYARVPGQGVRPSEVVMLMPPPGAPADEGGVVAKPLPVSNDPFVVCQRWLSGLGIRVPGILALDDEGDCMWLEDCGHEDFDQWLQRTRTPHVEGYQLPLGVLAQLQTMSQQRPVPALVASRVFDRPMLAWELEHYMEWRLQVQLGLSLPERARQAFAEAFARLVEDVAAIPLAPMHRDFQSHNLMVSESGEMIVLDFQDAMMGPIVYDAVALLRDSYVEIAGPDLDVLVRQACAAIAATGAADGASVERVERWFHLQTLQRKLKDSGRFVFIDRVKHNPSFLRWIDGSLRYVVDSARRLPDYADLLDLLCEWDPVIREAVNAEVA